MKPSPTSLIIAFCFFIVILFSGISTLSIGPGDTSASYHELLHDKDLLQGMVNGYIENEGIYKDSIAALLLLTQSWELQYKDIRDRLAACNRSVMSPTPTYMKTRTVSSTPDQHTTQIPPFVGTNILNNCNAYAGRLEMGTSYSYPNFTQASSRGYGLQIHAFKNLCSAVNFLKQKNSQELYLKYVYKENYGVYYYTIIYGDFNSIEYANQNRRALKRMYSLKDTPFAVLHIE